MLAGKVNIPKIQQNEINRNFYRTLFIWIVSLLLGWESFSWVQVVGFVIMVTGTFYFNGVLRWPFITSDVEGSERTPLLRSSNSDDE